MIIEYKYTNQLPTNFVMSRKHWSYQLGNIQSKGEDNSLNSVNPKIANHSVINPWCNQGGCIQHQTVSVYTGSVLLAYLCIMNAQGHTAAILTSFQMSFAWGCWPFL